VATDSSRSALNNWWRGPDGDSRCLDVPLWWFKHHRLDLHPRHSIEHGPLDEQIERTNGDARRWYAIGRFLQLRGVRRMVCGRKDGSWKKWTGPSIDSSSFCPIATVTNKVLLAECQSAGYVYPPASAVPRDWNNGASWLFISYDAGATFKPLRQLSRTYQGSYSTVSGLPATPVPGTILLQQETKSGNRLVRSSNWGRSWQVVLHRPTSQVVFTGRSIGFAIAQERQYHLGSSLLRTNDAGVHWSEVSF
jgi:hypothetical protein